MNYWIWLHVTFMCGVVVLVWRHGYHPNNAGIIQTYDNITLAYKKIVQPSKSSVVLKARQYNNCHAQLSWYNWVILTIMTRLNCSGDTEQWGTKTCGTSWLALRTVYEYAAKHKAPSLQVCVLIYLLQVESFSELTENVILRRRLMSRKCGNLKLSSEYTLRMDFILK